MPDYREVMVSVGNNSTIRVRKQCYSVPSGLIGTKLLARIYENRIVFPAGVQEVAQLPLGGGDRGAVTLPNIIVAAELDDATVRILGYGAMPLRIEPPSCIS